MSAQDRAGFGKPAFVRVFTERLPKKCGGPDTISVSVARLRLSHQSGGLLVVSREKGIRDPRHRRDGGRQGQYTSKYQFEFENQHGPARLAGAPWTAIRIAGNRADSGPKGSSTPLFDNWFLVGNPMDQLPD